MSLRHGTAALLCAVAVSVVAGCTKPPATKPALKPERVYVRLASLERAHPLAASLRDLTDAANRLRRDATAPAQTGATFILPALPVTPIDRAAGIRRNAAARTALRESALVTLRRYAVLRRRAELRIRAEERAELEGIARANSAGAEAAAKARIEAETRAGIFKHADAERNAVIQRGTAELNLSNGNVVSLALDPETKLPDEKELERQIVRLREREKETNPSPTPFSDEARLTKLLRDWTAELARIRKQNDRDLAFSDALIADAISTIRADNLIWVEDQLAKRPNRSNAQAELAGLQRELLALLQNLQADAATAPVIAASASLSATPTAIAPVRVSAADTQAAVHRLQKERDAIRAVIRRDTAAAVRDTGSVRNLEPVFSPAPNLPDKTAAFTSWIFGNVGADSLSNQKTTP